MSDGHCRDCKHWDPKPNDWAARGAGFRLCEGVRARWKVEDDVSPSINRYEDTDAWEAKQVEAFKAAKAYVQDGSDYVASLYTGPDFGCVLFEASTPTPIAAPDGDFT